MKGNRLTEKREGHNVIPLRKVGIGNIPKFALVEISENTSFLYGDFANKLASYEDTGLSPEEITAMIEDKGVPDNRSVIILPCKLGDKVFQISKGGVVVEARVDGIRFGSKRTSHNDEKYITLRDIWTGYSEKIAFSKFASEVFRTREAAEQELERRKNDK